MKQRSSSNDDDTDNSELNDSCNRLNDMTQRLLAATRNALSSQSTEAKDALAAEMMNVKHEVAHVAKVEQAKAGGSDLRMQLLKAAQNMTVDMGDFVSSLGVDGV